MISIECEISARCDPLLLPFLRLRFDFADRSKWRAHQSQEHLTEASYHISVTMIGSSDSDSLLSSRSKKAAWPPAPRMVNLLLLIIQWAHLANAQTSCVTSGVWCPVAFFVSGLSAPTTFLPTYQSGDYCLTFNGGIVGKIQSVPCSWGTFGQGFLIRWRGGTFAVAANQPVEIYTSGSCLGNPSNYPEWGALVTGVQPFIGASSNVSQCTSQPWLMWPHNFNGGYVYVVDWLGSTCWSLATTSSYVSTTSCAVANTYSYFQLVCGPGTYGLSGVWPCYLCAPGTYNSNYGQSACSGCPSGTYSTAVGATSSSTCLACASGQSSPLGSTRCFTLANPSLTGSSCRSIKASSGASAVTGWYQILVSSVNQTVYCDMTTDNGASYTVMPCNNCISVNQVDTVMSNGCTAVGMSMVVPRTQAHWSSLFNFVNATLNASLVDFFRTVPGVFMSSDGLGVSYGFGSRSCSIMNYATCSGEG